MIDSYRFGEMQIGGIVYQKDLICAKDYVEPHWVRSKGHFLSVSDIRKSVEENHPGIVVVGTGKFGLMKVPREVAIYLKTRNVLLCARPTDQAVEIFNSFISEEKNILGFFHLTC